MTDSDSGAPATAAAAGMARAGWSNVIVLSAGQLLAGIGVASGIAVGGVLAEQLSGSTAMAGLAQTCSILGTALAAIPLAHLARARGRRVALSTGYVVALAGVALVFVAVTSGIFPLFLVGMGLFGAATAAGLQSRFAAAEGVPASQVSRAMSIVLWATTVGSVAGPNLSQLGSDWGTRFGMEPLLGPYLFTGMGFVLAALAIGLLLRSPRSADPAPTILPPRIGTRCGNRGGGRGEAGACRPRCRLA